MGRDLGCLNQVRLIPRDDHEMSLVVSVINLRYTKHLEIGSGILVVPF
jgi:hypothetical protein